MNVDFGALFQKKRKREASGGGVSGGVAAVAGGGGDGIGGEVKHMNLRRTTRCTVRGKVPGLRSTCPHDELALLPASDWWLTSLLLAFPMPMRKDGIHEVGCLA